MANSVDPDQMMHSAASDLGVRCLLRPVSQNTLGNYGKLIVKTIAYQYLFTLPWA